MLTAELTCKRRSDFTENVSRDLCGSRREKLYVVIGRQRAADERTAAVECVRRPPLRRDVEVIRDEKRRHDLQDDRENDEDEHSDTW